MAKIMNSLLPNSALKKVGKTTRLFRYDLNQVPYNYTEEVTNRFKGLDLIDRVPEELWMEFHNIVHEVVIKTILKKKKCRKAKWFSGEVLQIAEKRTEAKGKGEKERYELWCWRRLLRVPWTARRSNQSILKEINLEYSLEGLISVSAEAETPTFWPPDVKSRLIGKDSDARKD